VQTTPRAGRTSRSQDKRPPILRPSHFRRSSVSFKRLAPNSEQILQSLPPYVLQTRASFRTWPLAFVTKVRVSEGGSSRPSKGSGPRLRRARSATRRASTHPGLKMAGGRPLANSSSSSRTNGRRHEALKLALLGLRGSPPQTLLPVWTPTRRQRTRSLILELGRGRTGSGRQSAVLRGRSARRRATALSGRDTLGSGRSGDRESRFWTLPSPCGGSSRAGRRQRH
jgi:hypothetical protein